jgi:DUF1680 family protein
VHVSTLASPYAKLSALPLQNISISGGFWLRRQEINRRVSLPHGLRKLEEAGNFHNLRLAAGLSQGIYQGPLFMDEDVYKWLEAVAYEIANTEDAGLERLAESTIDLLAAAQQDDGYLNSYYQVVEPGKRWTDLEHGHEMYCAGHLIQAAIAYRRTTGKTRLLEIACRFADHIAGTFGPGRRLGACGHPEIEMALVELYRETGKRCYLDLAAFFIGQRGQGKMHGLGRYGPEYHQDRVPVRQAQEVEGHAVRQLYLTTGVTDLYLETGEPALLAAMMRLWHDMTTHKMYLTGGLGARYEGESFGAAYELPSDRCYCETCASIASMMWNWRMLLATGEARFADLLELTLYNGFLSGVSLGGDRFFYVNPLQSRGGMERKEWYPVACCPPNIMRQIAAVGHYISTFNSNGFQIHQYISSRTTGEFSPGREAVLSLDTDYPWDGRVTIKVEKTDGSPWELSLRIPSWCEGATLRINNQAIDKPAPAGTYISLEQAWHPGDTLDLHLPMEPALITPNPRVDAIRGSLAIQRGPLIYCLEEIDQPVGTNLLDVRLDPTTPLRASWQEGLLGSVMTVEAQGAQVELGAWEDFLYRHLAQEQLPVRAVKLTAVPYFAWANRGPGAMRVWIPQT